MALETRLLRAQNQRFFVVEVAARTIALMGSTGNVYHVKLSVRPSCTCPDFKKRSRGFVSVTVCKHIIFLYVVIGPLDINNLKDGAITNEMNIQVIGILSTAYLETCGVMANANSIDVYNKIKSNHCMICSGSRLIIGNKWVQSSYHLSCVSTFHKTCINRHLFDQRAHNQNSLPCCPVCQQVWVEPESSFGPYLNLSNLVFNNHRDESNYEQEAMNYEHELEQRVQQSWNSLWENDYRFNENNTHIPPPDEWAAL